MTRLRSLLFNAIFLAWSVAMHLISLPVLLGPPAWVYVMGGLWVRGNLFLLRRVGGLGYRIEGLENLPDRPVIIAAKHQSIWETIAFCHIFRRPIFVLKHELLRIPFYGWYLRRIGMIAIDREGGATALRRLMAEARARLEAGKHIVIFPEGTRTRPGQRRPYHPGVAALYKQLGVPVLPVALNSGLFWPARSFRQKPGRITVRLLPPLPPGLDRREFLARLEQAIEDASRSLLPDRGRRAGAPGPVDNSVGKA
ncbi:MAG: 1-acyl-sn-glycerol-3-phosphate acyltransferase [Kiloniellales bacterium]|nr:1-acyl-sn-glycerol-3-phosphate acyltransferase [Kiloniellales bacterium]